LDFDAELCNASSVSTAACLMMLVGLFVMAETCAVKSSIPNGPPVNVSERFFYNIRLFI
jgi:hypothetical protein